VGRQLNEKCDKLGPNRVERLGEAVASYYSFSGIPESVVEWATESFRSFVSSGGPQDAIAWLLAQYNGELSGVETAVSG